MIPVKQEGNVFSQELCIPCYQTDSDGLLKPTAFMDIAQEIAYWAAEALGFGYGNLHIHHTAWVLARMHIRFMRPVRWRDAVTLFTWHKGTNGLFYLRDFLLRNSAGEIAIAATSSWVVIDELSRKMVRPDALQQFLETGSAQDAIAEPAPKLIMPKDMEPAGEHIVCSSEIDINHHVNNVRYVAWALDCLPAEDTSSGHIQDIIVNFHKETFEGEQIQLRTGSADGSIYVDGLLDDKSCFTVQIKS